MINTVWGAWDGFWGPGAPRCPPDGPPARMGQGGRMIASVFVRRLKPGRTFAEFVAEWTADVGFGVPTRVFNAPSLDDPRDIITIGFVAVSVDQLRTQLAAGSASEQVRHDRIDTVIESTSLRGMYEVCTEHDFTGAPVSIDVGSADSLLHALAHGR